MNITFVITTLTGGGAERVASILCNEWSRMGHNVSIVLTSIQSSCPNYLTNNVQIITLSPNKRKTVRWKITEIKKIFLKLKTDIAVSFFPNSSYMVQKAIKRTKILSFVSERNDPTHKKGFIQEFLKKITFKNADGVVFQTENVKNMFRKKIREKSIVISNPASPGLTKCDEHTKTNNSIISVGRLVEQKRYLYLINSFYFLNKVLPNITLQIYGKGPQYDVLVRRIKELNLQERIFINDYTNEITSKICESTLFVMPSLFEGFPNSLLEAVVIGKPCVVSRFKSGAAECLIKNGYNGLILDVDESPEKFAEKMIEVLENIKIYSQNAIEQSVVIEKLNSSDKIAKQWIDFFEEKLYERK